MGIFKFLSVKNLDILPKGTGVYCLKKGKEILYIGKAKNIRERVKNHFQNPSWKERDFLKEVEKIGYLITDSEIEALILEAKLIKKYQPKLNILWRDDKNYFFVAKTKEDFPRIFITHQPKEKAKEYIGPFVDGKSLKIALRFLRKVFPFRSCALLPKKPCFWYQLGYCLGPCLVKNKNDLLYNHLKKLSQRNAKKIFSFFRGGGNKILKNLEKEMQKKAEKLQFEEAEIIRDQWKSLKRVIEQAKVLEEEKKNNWQKTEGYLRKFLKIKKKIERIEAYDVSNIRGKEATGSMIVFLEGKPAKNFYRRFKIKLEDKPNDLAMLKEVLMRRLNHREWPLPQIVLIDGGRGQLKIAEEVFSKRKNRIKILALAKKENKIFIAEEKKAYFLKDLPREIFNLFLQLRDEAHRFAISYHRKLREKELLKK